MDFRLRGVSVRGGGFTSLRRERSVAFGPAVAEELPHFTNFGDHIQVEISYHNFVFVPAGLGNNFAAWIAEIALAVKLANAPGFFDAYAVDGAHKITVRNGMRGLLQFPQIFREPRNCRRRIEHDFRTVQSQNARTLRKMAIVANVDANPRVFWFENRVPKIAGGEVKLLPETGMAVRDVVLAVFSQIAAVGIDHGGGVEIHPRHLLFVNRNHDHHAMFRRELLHQAHRRTIRDSLG